MIWIDINIENRPYHGETVIAFIEEGTTYQGGYCLLEYTYNGWFTAYDPINQEPQIRIDKKRILKWSSIN